MIELKKRIHDENNGLWYALVGDYYIPQLSLPTEMQRPIGKWGRMHRDYLKENHPAQFADLILHGNMAAYLADLNDQAQHRLEVITDQMKAAEGVTEENPHGDFYVMNGNRALIKREKFEHYLDQATAV